MSTRIQSIQTSAWSNGDQETFVKYGMFDITTPEIREWLITGDNILHFAKLVNMSDEEAMLMKLDMSVNKNADIRPDVLYIIHDAMMRAGYKNPETEIKPPSYGTLRFILDKNTPPDILRYFEKHLETFWEQRRLEENDYLDSLRTFRRT